MTLYIKLRRFVQQLSEIVLITWNLMVLIQAGLKGMISVTESADDVQPLIQMVKKLDKNT